MSVKFKSMVRVGGNSNILTVPKPFFDGGMIILDREYLVTLEEVEEE